MILDPVVVGQKNEILRSLMLGFAVVVSQDPRQQSVKFKTEQRYSTLALISTFTYFDKYINPQYFS